MYCGERARAKRSGYLSGKWKEVQIPIDVVGKCMNLFLHPDYGLNRLVFHTLVGNPTRRRKTRISGELVFETSCYIGYYFRASEKCVRFRSCVYTNLHQYNQIISVDNLMVQF